MEQKTGERKMQIGLINKIGGVFFIFLGLGFTIFHRAIAKFAIMMWRKNLQMKPPSELGYQISFLIIGIVFVIFGLLYLLGIFK